jgi:hypothetical protein
VLSDRERDVLDEVERRLLAGDPEFAALFDAQARPRAAGRPYRPGTMIGAVLVIAFGVLVLLASSPSIALLATLSSGVLWVAWRYADLGAGLHCGGPTR